MCIFMHQRGCDIDYNVIKHRMQRLTHGKTLHSYYDVRVCCTYKSYFISRAALLTFRPVLRANISRPLPFASLYLGTRIRNTMQSRRCVLISA